MPDIQFMKKKFSRAEMITHYLADVKNLQSVAKTPEDQQKLKIYYQAAQMFKDVSIKDIVQFALSYGRSHSGKSAQLSNAFQVLLGNHVQRATAIDIAYAKLLYEYTKAFKAYRGNLKEWLLRFVLSSRFSPLHSFIERGINYVLQTTKERIAIYS